MNKAKGARTAPKKETRGRHKVDPAKKVMKNNLFPEQWHFLEQEAKSRQPSVPTAYILREAVDWYIAAKHAQVSSSVATKEQDADFEALVANTHT